MLPVHLPFDGDASRLRMGLRPLDPTEWIELDDGLEAEVDEKRRVLAEHHDEVVARLDDDGTRTACLDLVDALVDHLGTQFPATYVFEDGWWLLDGVEPVTPVAADAIGAEGLHPVEAAGRLTQEDWCVMLPDSAGVWRMVAGCVCFPTRWVMPDKLGGDLWGVHAPVAHYDRELGRPVESFFTRITPDTPKWRANWNVVDDPELFQPVARGHFARTGPHPVESVGDLVWLRVERQTFVKLPATGAVVFGIRVHMDPLRSLAGSPEVLSRLGGSLRTLTPEAWAYKSLDGYGDEVLAWIDRCLAAQ